ncbi:MAG: UbiD family decarboxylase [Flavobacteriales bacterium]|nr:UbiD family decarboxylase [Flavobacteriales bacterium]
MAYRSLQDCIRDLEKHGHLVRIRTEVDPDLEMAAIHRRVFAAKGPAILFENVKGSEFPAVSNLFGDINRTRFIFRDTLDQVKALIEMKADPGKVLKHPVRYFESALHAIFALPKKRSRGPVLYRETTLDKLPQIRAWQMDGGPYIFLPQVFTEDPMQPGVMHSNLGCYRVQMAGNDFVPNKEMGLHYQIHRGIGVHQSKANELGQPLKVSIFVGGPPSHSFAAVMPLPEGISELTFAGALGGRRFRYIRKDGHVLSADADFVITGELHPGETKPEGPFGDHLGYYSLTHPFPLMRVHKVYHRKGAIWPFTVVGRPPQEDTSFGAMIHELVGPVVSKEIPGLHRVHAIDEAGVHPLLLAVGSERYTPYLNERRPQEILTMAHAILGFGQMSLSKYLWIAAREDNPSLDVEDVQAFFMHMLERVDWKRDLHFDTQTTIDTLDYSGDGLNSGSKLVVAAAGEKKRSLTDAVPEGLNLSAGFSKPRTVFPGVLAISGPPYTDRSAGVQHMHQLEQALAGSNMEGLPLVVLCDDSEFTAASHGNFLWVTFTRSNPSHDIGGVDAFTDNKHWGCRGSLVIDARIKPHHAPVLEEDPAVAAKVDALGKKGGELEGRI